MELSFPQGDLDRSMSDELQNEFYEKMKPAIWAIKVGTGKDNNDIVGATGFCVDASGLLLTVAHVFKGEAEESEVPLRIYARRDKDEDGKFWRCEICFKLKHFDLALLKVSASSNRSEKSTSKDGNSSGFDYVPIDGDISRKIPILSELWTIGHYRSQGFHFLIGTLSYGHKDGDTDYFSLAKETEFDSTRNLKDSNLYVDRPYCVIKGSFYTDPEMHPELKYLQMNFSGMTDFLALAGAPVFNSKGKVIAIVQNGKFSVNGVTSSAMAAILRCYRESLE